MIPTVLATDNSVTVNFSVFDGSVIMPNEKITVYDGIAEEYGYELASADHNGNPVNGITIFDVVVAAHKKLYGDAFTPETANNYLVMTYSFMTKSFVKILHQQDFSLITECRMMEFITKAGAHTPVLPATQRLLRTMTQLHISSIRI